MARCESVDMLQQITSSAETQEMESNDSDSGDDISPILVPDRSGESCKDNNAETQEMESSDSDSDNDIQIVIPDRSGENSEDDDNPDSPESAQNGGQINNGPVLSLQCLHEDSADEGEESCSARSEFIDVDDVPELSVIYAEEDNNKNINHESEEDDEHPHLVKIASNKGSITYVSPAASCIPARNNWDGAHNFKIKIQCSNTPRKSDSPMYSELQNKLYIAKDHPFKVLVYADNVPIGSMIKVSAVFSLVEHSYEVVQRCPTHAQQDFSKGSTAYEHFIQCFSEAAIYEKNRDNGKLSVSVPYEKPQEGETCTTYLFKLTCFSSCIGGINRRPFMLVFSLEKDNVPLGRQTLEAKVCACPLRDFRVDEERERKRNSKAVKASKGESPVTSKQEITPKYSISVKDPELYQFLKQMKYLYETNVCSAKIKSDT